MTLHPSKRQIEFIVVWPPRTRTISRCSAFAEPASIAHIRKHWIRRFMEDHLSRPRGPRRTAKSERFSAFALLAGALLTRYIGSGYWHGDWTSPWYIDIQLQILRAIEFHLEFPELIRGCLREEPVGAHQGNVHAGNMRAGFLCRSQDLAGQK